MIEYRKTVEKLKSKFSDFEEKVKEFQKELFEEHLESKTVIYHILRSRILHETTEDIDYFYACKSNSEPISKDHVSFFVEGKIIHYHTSQILQATEIIAHSAEELPQFLCYTVIDDYYVKINYTPKYSQNKIRKKLSNILHQVVKMTDEEWQFIEQVIRYQIDQEFCIYTDTIFKALEKYPIKNITFNEIREAVKKLNAEKSFEQSFEQNE